MTQFGSVVGLDLSLTSTGFSCTAPGDPRAYTRTVKSKGSKADSWGDRWKRLSTLADDIAHQVPDDFPLIVVEAPSYGSNSGSQHDRSGLWWLVYQRLSHEGYWIVPVPPTVRAKYATGKGNAGKDAVLAAAVRRYANIDITGNDVADAVVLMAIGCRLLGEPIDDPMPAVNLSALAKLPSLEEAA
ncbi:hypothetical protein [Nocardia asiatica]|uniref:hypothetical protein n=1 Tax=Nocardia asiatica TaxID=209252 RepID=UPI0002E67135|nr:hypothetical protein [Nocardia asiatica]